MNLEDEDAATPLLRISVCSFWKVMKGALIFIKIKNIYLKFFVK